jgi:MFS family permease
LVSAFLYWASLYLYVSTLPIYAQTKTDSLALVGVILSMYGLWQAVVRLPLGIAADWLGWRKPFILVGLALSGLGASLMAVAGGANGLIVGRAVTGLAAGTWVPMVAVFSSFFPPQDAVRASAILTLVSSAARALATSLNGSLNNVGGYSLAFWAAAIVAALAILALLPSIEHRRPPRKPSLRGIGRLIVRKDVLLPAALQAIGQYADWTATFGFVPVLARALGATDVELSLLVSMNIGVVLIGNLLAMSAVRRAGTHSLVYIAFVLMAAGIGGAALAGSLAFIFAAQCLIGLGQGFAYPLLMGMSIERVPNEERTTAMGLHQAVYALGMFGGPWLSGRLADVAGIRPTFGITASACLALGLAGTWWLSHPGVAALRTASESS